MRICDFVECEEKHYAKGFCKKHYGRTDAPKRSRKKHRLGRGKAAFIKARKERKLRLLGWTLEMYNLYNYAQNGLCYICGESNYTKGLNRELSADHDHKTGLPRGLLCTGCNTRLGHLEKHLIQYRIYLGI